MTDRFASTVSRATVWYAVAVAVLLAGSGWVWLTVAQSSTATLEGAEGPLVGHLAPPFEAVSMFEGDTLQWEWEDDGGPIVLNFWASWCPPCVREIPELMETADRYRGEVTILGIIEPGDLSDARRMAQDFRINYDLAVDAAEVRAFETYEVFSLPTTYFIDRNGVIQARITGEMNSAVLTEGISRILN